MLDDSDLKETILIVDDEESVRKTFQEWLEEANLGCHLLTAADAESALIQANQHAVDLAILDWNLGSGNDGLQLLEDLYLFHPDVIAIMITGFAHQATPLDAMRMGVRDYLDKNQNLDRETFLRAVRRQLERIRPAKRERRLHQSLVAFRQAIEKALPLVQSAAALNDPVPIPRAVGSLLRFLLRITSASDGILLVYSIDGNPQPRETCRAYDANGALLPIELVPFARSLAGAIVSLQGPCVMSRLDEVAKTGGLELQLFEQNRQSLLVAPLSVAPGIHVILELFDKKIEREDASFTEGDRRLVAATAEFGVELLRQAFAERQGHQVLFAALDAALGATDSVAQSLFESTEQRLDAPPPAVVIKRLREELSTAADAAVGAEETLHLAEAVRVLAVRHGAAAVKHCTKMVESVREMLDGITGTGEVQP